MCVLKMLGLAFQELPASDCAHELPIAYRDFAADGDDARTAFQFPALKRAVVHVHRLGGGGDVAAPVRVEHYQVGIATGLNGALAGKETEDLRGLRAGDSGQSRDI